MTVIKIFITGILGERSCYFSVCQKNRTARFSSLTQFFVPLLILLAKSKTVLKMDGINLRALADFLCCVYYVARSLLHCLVDAIVFPLTVQYMIRKGERRFRTD